VLVVVAVALLTLLYRPVELTYFDRGFAQSVGVRAKSVDLVLFILLVFAIVIGLRSVGVVLMAGMLIAPAVSARQFTHRLPSLFALSSFFGVVSAFGGNYFSLLIPQWVSKGEGRPFSLPTGPMILLCSALIAFFCLLFAPERGVVNRYFRLRSFKRRCQVENALKTVHRKGKERSFSLKELHESGMSAFLVMRHLLSQGLAEKCKEHGYALTPKGKELAIRVVHMHRLWAAYLIFLGHGVVKTHCTVEEMEHILTPELEKELTTLMKGGEDESLLGD
jgi:manganese/zinc/iron transport system permease protein